MLCFLRSLSGWRLCWNFQMKNFKIEKPSLLFNFVTFPNKVIMHQFNVINKDSTLSIRHTCTHKQLQTIIYFCTHAFSIFFFIKFGTLQIRLCSLASYDKCLVESEGNGEAIRVFIFGAINICTKEDNHSLREMSKRNNSYRPINLFYTYLYFIKVTFEILKCFKSEFRDFNIILNF